MPPAPNRIFGAVVRPLQAFLALEAASGILLIACAVIALVWANLGGSYERVFHFPLALGAGGTLAHFTFIQLINDGLMTIFFFVVGMEVKRELAVGELSSPSRAALPLIAALGGMVVPAGIFLAFNYGGPGQHGWGIPMATDIAFCVGILTLLKSRVPHGLVVFLVALAIFDDIGGILVIALFYGHGLDLTWLATAGVLTWVLFLMNRSYVRSAVAYFVVAAGLWYALHVGGIHATIAGVIAGLMIPATARRSPREVIAELADHSKGLLDTPEDAELDAAQLAAIEDDLEDLMTPLDRFVEALHPWVAFLIMPLFALGNSGVSLEGVGLSSLTAPVTLGAGLGLLLGKQVGVFATTFIAVRLGFAPMPGGASMAKLLGVAILAGIGFTVALFIAALAFPGHPELLKDAKLGILLGSLCSGVIAYTLLRSTKAIPLTGADEAAR